MVLPGKERIMSVIVMATPKGGAGKSTTSLVLGLTWAKRGATVSLVDADANQPLVCWADDRPRSVEVVGSVTESTFLSTVDQRNAAKDVVIIDLEGAATRVMSRAIMRADLVLIPMQGSALDAQQAARMVGLVRQEEEALGRAIPFRVVLTRTSEKIPTRTTKALLAEMATGGIPALRAQLNERAAFRVLFERKCELHELDESTVSGVPQAIRNADVFADDVTTVLHELAAGVAA
jgi:chromosome partitioning protein